MNSTRWELPSDLWHNSLTNGVQYKLSLFNMPFRRPEDGAQYAQKHLPIAVLGPSERHSIKRDSLYSSVYIVNCLCLFALFLLCSLVSSETLTLLTYFLPSITKFNSFDTFVTTPNPRYCRFNRWLLYFNEWSGTVTKKIDRKTSSLLLASCVASPVCL